MNKEALRKFVWSAEGLALVVLIGVITWLIYKR
jgi:heme exporter protein D